MRSAIGIAAIIFLMMAAAPGMRAEAGDIYNSPYVTFSPDGRAWTTNAGDRNCVWYPWGTKVTTGIPSSIRAVEQGEHYYKAERTGTVPVGEWEAVYKTGTCVHDSYPEKGTDWHGVRFGRDKCLGYYYSGWNAKCADCGDRIVNMHMYMSREAAGTIRYLEAGTGMDYYYLCPWCNNLEMGSGIPAHWCNAISWNQYQVHYDANTSEIYGGYMADSIHMYNNAAEYEGKPVTPVTHLTPNAYSRIGYEFEGWNTSPDGSGTYYEDCAEIWNLTDQNRVRGSGEGVVTLYAQWRSSESILEIDPCGGIYEDSRDITHITGSYRSTYQVDEGKLIPPEGSRISFQTNGGSELKPVRGSLRFEEWIPEQPFHGEFRNGEYQFTAPDGNVDRIKASYVLEAVVLPLPVKEGSSFGGWYYDSDFGEPAGDAGDEIVPARDMILYAQWVELKLQAVDNYTANEGKGAVDLSWSQADGKNKVYLLYQSRNGRDWERIHSADEIGSGHVINEKYEYNGTAETFTVPCTGFYTITAEGAKGRDYGENKGGAGGRVTARVWLTEGEIVTCTAGGSDGFNGGGEGTDFAGGGGCTIVSTDRQGMLMTAGGGGGASQKRDGGPGGSVAGLRMDEEWKGAAGQAGGGAGYVGGQAGETVIHYHSEACIREADKNILHDYGSYRSTYVETYEDGDDEGKRYITQYGSSQKLIPVGAAAALELEVLQSMMRGHNKLGNYPGDSYLAVYDQNGTRIFYKRGYECEQYEIKDYTEFKFDEDDELDFQKRTLAWGKKGQLIHWITYDEKDNITGTSNNFTYIPDVSSLMAAARKFGGTTAGTRGTEWYYRSERAYLESFAIPEGTTGIYIVSSVAANDFVGNTFYKAALTGERQFICGYTEGQVLSDRQAYGGSNYVNSEHCTNYSEEAGVGFGDGSVLIQSEVTGFREELQLNGVTAKDMAPPDAIALNTVKKKAVEGRLVHISWEEPKDYGTDYYHMAESYLAGSSSPLCSSNITQNNLKSGVYGYYYLADEEADTTVSEKNASFIREACLDFIQGKEEKYLHVAAVDKAGNFGPTVHIPLTALNLDVKWKLYTEALYLEEGENVYYAAGEGAYYVRCDEETPFTVEYGAYMDGMPGPGYQINYAVFEEQMHNCTAKNILHCRNSVIQEADFVMAEDEFSYSATGENMIAFYPYTEAVRRDGGRVLQVIQKFTLSSHADGKKIKLIPAAGADHKEEIVYSDHEKDEQNGLILIGDGEPPVIRGMEPLEYLEMLDRNAGNVLLEIRAEDKLSGVSSFYVEIVNQDNTIQKIYSPDGDGVVRVDITRDEPVFSGDFTVTAHAEDHVGNKKKISCDTMEFALQADVERILEPHDPVFQCGESGILKISVWGYADRVEVEFPEVIAKGNPEYNKIYEYSNTPQYRQNEELQFMIPLDASVNENFAITVRAYKGNRKLEEHPAISIVEVDGTILDDFRTRLR